MATYVVISKESKRPLRVINAQSHDNLRKAIIAIHENNHLYTGPGSNKKVEIYLATVDRSYDSLPKIAMMDLGTKPGEYKWMGLVPRNLTVGWRSVSPKTGKLR